MRERIVGLTFGAFEGQTPGLSGHARSELFRYLPKADQEACWANLEWQAARETERKRRDPLLYDDREAGHPPQQRSTFATSTRPGSVALSHGDPLKTIPPVEYVERLTGWTVPANGFIHCPFPGHEDRTPSFRVYGDHTWCFGCGRGGGDIYGFGGALYDLDPRRDFLELRRRLAAALGGTHA